ncbi:MAG: hypothetical protein IPM18_00870 [Phycisphaerales bacterium]|nr:hypothetical protein [Phycisphaerales bacterium]
MRHSPDVFVIVNFNTWHRARLTKRLREPWLALSACAPHGAWGDAKAAVALRISTEQLEVGAQRMTIYSFPGIEERGLD